MTDNPTLYHLTLALQAAKRTVRNLARQIVVARNREEARTENGISRTNYAAILTERRMARRVAKGLPPLTKRSAVGLLTNYAAGRTSGFTIGQIANLVGYTVAEVTQFVEAYKRN